jgi:hypothetical protein
VPKVYVETFHPEVPELRRGRKGTKCGFSRKDPGTQRYGHSKNCLFHAIFHSSSNAAIVSQLFWEFE